MANPFSRCCRLLTFVALMALSSGLSWAGGLVEIPFDPDDFGDPLTIDNIYWPLVPGTTFHYSAETEDGCVVTDVTVTYQTKTILTIDTRVVEDLVWLDEDCDGLGDVLLEETDDWYAQDDNWNIWYMGEWTTSYFDDEGNPVVNHDGSWEAGQEGAEAGIIMLGDPAPGLFYRQEYLAGEAEDMAKVLRLNSRVEVQAGDAEDCLKTKEWTTLSPGEVEHKYYCPGWGLLLVQELSGGKTVLEELVGIDVDG